jgi:acyl-coenzyme A synthetase/AMP-(fatty) acid ligase
MILRLFKVNGQKVSAIAIQQQIIKSNLVKDAAVIPICDKQSAFCVVFYVEKNDIVFNKADMLGFLRASLPANHLPKYFIQLVILQFLKRYN